MQVRNHADKRNRQLVLHHVQTRLENVDIAAEFIDNETLDALLFLRLQQRNRAVQRGEHAAAVDVSDEQHRRVHHFRHAHIHDVIFAQIDFRRRACALNDNDIIFLRQTVICLQNIRNQLFFVRIIVLCRHRAARHAVDDNLGAAIAGRLEQNRIHAHIRCNARRLCLHDLRASHLGAVRRDKRIERHVLRLKRRRLEPVLSENAAQCRNRQALARIGCRALYHDYFCHADSSFSCRSVCSSTKFSVSLRTAMRNHVSSSP